MTKEEVVRTGGKGMENVMFWARPEKT